MVLLASLFCLGVCSLGCEVSHYESSRPGWFGGHKHEETTVIKNPITGDTSVHHTEERHR
jgi:hypothetical protein